MKEIQVPELAMTCQSLDSAFDSVFGPDTLARVHGPSTRVEPFKNNERTFTFDIDVSSVPRMLRCFFCGPRMRVTTRQTMERSRNDIRVTNHIKMHVVGAELFRVKPTFWLDRKSSQGIVVLGGIVQHEASLPPPLRGIAERFMAAHSERELRRFEQVLRERGAL